MKACLYSPYLPGHFGGGEKYLLDVALALTKNCDVFIAIPPDIMGDQARKIKTSYEIFFNLDLSQVTFIVSPLGSKGSALNKIWWTKQFDILYYLTDGSLFLSLARRNILHFQIPFTHFSSSFFNRLKLANWQVKNTNSMFTKKVIEKYWPCTIDVVHHPMIVSHFVTDNYPKLLEQKQKVILSVGRFFKQLHSKRQDVLIEAFRRLYESEPKAKNWKLVLIGGIEDESYASQLHQKASNLPIEFFHHLNKNELEKWYEAASIYWHATGFGVDPIQHPEKVEHFGISTVEAMSNGVVPIVVGKGGQVEVLGEKLKHFLWQEIDECVTLTKYLINDEEMRYSSQILALQQATNFSPVVFKNKLQQMIRLNEK